MFNNLDNISVDQIKFDGLTVAEVEYLKSLFNYSSPNSIEEFKFAQKYNRWFASKQIGSITNGRLQVSITLLNEDLSLNTKKIKYLHTSQIKDLSIDFELYGFSGELSFNFPYNLEKENLWSDLANYQNKFVVELAYQEDIDESGKGNYKPNKYNGWSVRGYIDLTKNDAVELTDQISQVDSSIGVRHYLSCKLFFTDVFAFIAKQHYPVKVYPQSSYVKVFDSIFKNFNNLLNISNIHISKDITILDTQYNWICVNCDYPRRSFYDFFFYTLRHYQLQLIYDYSSKDPSYSIVDLTKPEPNKAKSKELPVGIIIKIVNQIGDYSFSNTNLINQHWTTQEESSISIYASGKSVLVSKDHVFGYPVPSTQLKSAKEFYKKEIDNTGKKLKCTNLEWGRFPEEFTILPKNKFTLPKSYQQILPQYTGDLVISRARISFKNYKKITIYAGQESIYTTCASDKDISSIDYQLKQGINIKTQVCSADTLALSFPDFDKSIKDLSIYGWIDDLNDSSKDTIYFVTEGDNPTSQKDTSADFVASKQTSFLMSDRTNKELSYIVKLPPDLNGTSKKPFYITLPYFILQDHEVIPLRKGTPVAISLSQESGSIDRVMWHSMQDKTFSKDSQINKVVFGSNDSAGVIHQAKNQKLKEGSLEIFSKTSSNKTQIISDKSQMSLVYSEE
ncbi:hypothetical protein CDV26_08995 [Francisella halioticida]|uniref:Phage tail protein n=1 Tax=Francisella halioticida TaxID=549298 RepID=A0ABN5AX74_9GAMM|nr:hypothetical protein [Francisella halioticida]ASG68509.1 hypothetical protein CDV26_08995 [Francisella halioticida]